jgi:hypothetical protein
LIFEDFSKICGCLFFTARTIEVFFNHKYLRNTGDSSKGFSLCKDRLTQSDESETWAIFLRAEATDSREFVRKLQEASANRSKAIPLSVVHYVGIRSYYFMYV